MPAVIAHEAVLAGDGQVLQNTQECSPGSPVLASGDFLGAAPVAPVRMADLTWFSAINV